MNPPIYCSLTYIDSPCNIYNSFFFPLFKDNINHISTVGSSKNIFLGCFIVLQHLKVNEDK